MLYHLVRPLARVAIKVFFRKIYFCHPERIPRRQPVVLAANHPTAFLEPMVLAVLLRQPLYFLVRGDFFRRPLYARLLRSLNMIPLHRLEDSGFGHARSNRQTFTACSEGLHQGKTILIFPEGHTVNEKRLRPLQKGLARVAFGALDDFPELPDVFIVPVGVNYTYPDRPRESILISFGEPLSTRQFLEANRQTAQNNLTSALKDAMRQQLVEVPDPQDDALVEYLLQLTRSHFPEPVFPIKSSRPATLEREKAVAQGATALDPTRKAALLEAAQPYFAQLDHYQLRDVVVANPPASLLGGWLRYALGWLPQQLGYWFCYLPTRWARVISQRKVPQIEYQIPVRLALNWAFVLLYFLLWALLALALAQPMILVAAIALGGLGYFSLLQQEWQQNWRAQRAWQRLGRPQQEALQQQRAQLLAAVQPWWPTPATR